jgi:hypothetical protein
MIDLDPTLNEQLLDIAIREPEPQIPAHRENDHLGREPEPRKRRHRHGGDMTRTTSNHPPTLTDGAALRQRNSAHVGLIDEPAVADDVTTGPGCIDEQGGEPLHPPVHGHMIDVDPALAEKLVNIAIRQPEPQIPPHRKHNHLWREPVPRATLNAGLRVPDEHEIGAPHHCCPRTRASPNATEPN